MPVSPQEFSLWARMTGNKYPNSVEEKARLAPEVHNFSQNIGKQGALGVQEEPEPEQKSNLGSNLAKGALIAGGIAAGVAAARNPGVQEAVKSAASKVDDFVSNFTTPRTVNVDTAEAVSDITKAAPGDIYSQSTIPTHQIENYYAPAGLLRSGPQTQYEATATDVPPRPLTEAESRHERIKVELANIAASRRARQERADPGPGGRQLTIPGRNVYEDGVRKAYVPGIRTWDSGFKEDPITGQSIVHDTSQVDPSTGKYKRFETGELAATYPSIPLSEAPDQGSLFSSRLSDKVQALAGDIGTPHTEFGHVQHSPSELSESVAASGQNPVNTGMTGNIDNLIEKTSGTYDPTTLTGQRDIQMAANNAVDQVENDAIAAVLNIKQVEADNSGIVNPKVDNFLKIQSAQRQNAAISDLDRQAYDIVAAGAEVGQPVSLERAQQILTDPNTELTFGEQRLFRGDDRVAIGQQTFTPGERQSGQMMRVRSGASGRETAITDADRYNLENVAGLTKQTRKGAGTSAMRGEEDRPNIAGVLPTGGGRNTRGMSAVGSNILDAAIGEQAAREELSDLTSNVVRKELEARNQPEQTYSKFTDYSTGQTDEGRARDAATLEKAQSNRRHQQMNQLFAAPTEGGLLQLRTSNRGNIKLSREDLNATLGPIAEDVWHRAAGHFAQQQGIELPDASSPDYFSAANNAIYGNKNTVSQNTQLVGQAFNKELQNIGIQLTEGGQDPFASHTLFSIARQGATGELSLREFTNAARRAQSRGILDRNPDAPVPYGLTAPGQTGTSYQPQVTPPQTERRAKGRKISFNVPTREGINTPAQPTETSSGKLSAADTERIARQKEVFRKIRERMGLPNRDSFY